jgi:hypothetical protein
MLLRKLRQTNERSHDFAEADDVGNLPDRQQFAVAPHVGGPLRQRILGQGLLHAGEVVTHQQRLAGLGKVMNLVGGIMIALHRAFEMGHEVRAFDGEIIVVFHVRFSFLFP